MSGINNYTGYETRVFTDEGLSRFYSADNAEDDYGIKENQYIFLKYNNEIVDIYVRRNNSFEKIEYQTIGNNFTGIIKPRNPEQQALFDMLNNDDIKVKLVSGIWGSGKTMSIAVAALSAVDQGKFEKIIWVRNNVDVKDTVPLGALPGDEYAKLLPFAMPLADHCGGIEGLRYLMDSQKLEIVHLGFLRGRDIRNSIIMCSEAENLTKEHIQLILGRVGEGSALYMDADLRQRDKVTFEKSKGLEIMVDRLKGNPLFGYVHLVKSERSATARLADLMN